MKNPDLKAAYIAQLKLQIEVLKSEGALLMAAQAERNLKKLLKRGAQ